MRSVFIKEINSFFSSIVGYVAVLVFLVACGLFMWILPDSSILDYGYASLDRFFRYGPLAAHVAHPRHHHALLCR